MDWLPVLPLGQLVVYPHVVLPLAITDLAAVELLDEVVQGNKRLLLGVVKSRGGVEPLEGPLMQSPADALYDVGTLGTIVRMLKLGDGSMRDCAEQLVAALPEQTRWSRRLSAEEVAAAMDDAWLVCLPSRSEGLPRVALEAACRGRAIVGGNRAGIPDVVSDGANGLLVDPDDADELAEALVRILSDRAYTERLGATSRRTGEEWGVSPADHAAKVRALVDGVLAG